MPRLLIERAVELTTRDGETLCADVIRPDVDAPVPAVLVRNPYAEVVARAVIDPIRIAGAGFAVVLQSTRGTGQSGGQFEPWVNEQADGADTIAWCARQPWCSGSVGMIGPSYLAQTQLYAAGAATPELKALVPVVAPGDPYSFVYNGGALSIGFAYSWATEQALLACDRGAAMGDAANDVRRELQRVVADLDHVLWQTPLTELPLPGGHDPGWAQWLKHPSSDAWWQARKLPGRPDLPAFFTAGWWDVFLPDTLREWGKGVAPGSRLVIGPWSHISDSALQGERNYGVDGSRAATDQHGAEIEFLRRHLTQPPASDGEPPKVSLFVMGSDVWRDDDCWPPAVVSTQRLFLHSDGSLSAGEPTAEEAPVPFTFDPRNPVPTLGGRTLMANIESGYRYGPWDQRPLDDRSDILRFTSVPLSADLEVIGPLTVSLCAASSAVDTDWTAKLIDVYPDGRAMNVADGIIRARYRDGTDVPRLLTPGKPERYSIDLGATAQMFAAGHRLRLDISSSNFPRYDRNPGTGEPVASVPESRFVIARQTIFTDAAQPSWLSVMTV